MTNKIDFSSLKSSFDNYIGVQKTPNAHEKALFERAEKYIGKIENTPGIEMIAICNSLSMFATHEDSDIDLFIVTRPGMLWFVRFFVTLRFWQLKVWRKGEDIAGNFCLSFFVTTDELDLSKIAIKNDIYLYYWIYYLKPITQRNNTYEKFLESNSWVEIYEEQKKENLTFLIPTHEESDSPHFLCHCEEGNDVAIQKDEKQETGSLRSSRGHKHQGFKFCLFLNTIIRFFLRPKTLKTYEKLGKPGGVIISDDMLKFHDQDRRTEIRDAILGKNFDK